MNEVLETVAFVLAYPTVLESHSSQPISYPKSTMDWQRSRHYLLDKRKEMSVYCMFCKKWWITDCKHFLY